VCRIGIRSSPARPTKYPRYPLRMSAFGNAAIAEYGRSSDDCCHDRWPWRMELPPAEEWPDLGRIRSGQSDIYLMKNVMLPSAAC